MKTSKAILLIALSLLIFSCSKEKKKDFALNGAWLLESVVTPDGFRDDYPQDNVGVLRIYDDSCFYECRITTAPNGMLVTPSFMSHYTVIDRGKGGSLYLEENDKHPLTVKNDSTMVIQTIGRRYTWNKTSIYDEERTNAIIDIIRNNEYSNADYSFRYVFSDAEKDLETYNHTLVYILIFIVLALLSIVNYALKLHKKKKRIENELRQIEQERQAMPEPVREAMSTVEEDFHNGEFYLSLRKKIANGSRLTQADWNGIEEKFKSVYPRFTSTLLTLYNMSRTEMLVCLLLKLNASPSEIAGVLNKDASTISSTRSRLYMKVFGKKGGSKEWDEFIHSL